MWNMGRRFETLTVYLTGVTTPLEKALKRATSYIGKFKSVVTSGAGMLGVGLGFTALIAGAKRLIDTMDGIGKAAGNLGIATEEYQKLSYAARRTNTPMQMVEMAMMKARKMSGDLAVGNAEAAKTFGALGLRLQDLQGLKTDELFGRIVSALNYVEDPLKRSALQAKLFGESGEKLNNFLRDYNALGREAAARGMIIKETEIKAAENLKDSLERLNTAFTRLSANTGWVSVLADAVKGLDIVLNRASYVNEAARGGFYTRESGVDYALQRAKESGRYTPEQLELMKKGSNAYKRMTISAFAPRGSFDLLDQALKESGLSELARTNPQNHKTMRQWEGTQKTARRQITVAEATAAEEKQKQEREERAKRNASAAAETAARAAQEERKKNDDALTVMVNTATRNNRIADFSRSGNDIEAELLRRLGPLADNFDKLNPAMIEELRKLIETENAAKKQQEKDRKQQEFNDKTDRLVESFYDQIRNLDQRAEIDQLRREGKTLDADLLEKVYSFKNQGLHLTDDKIETMRKALEKVQTPATVAVAEQRSAITAALQGSLEAYRARVNQGKNIPDQQLKVQQQQLSEQKKTNQLLANNKAGGATLEVAAIGGV